MYNQGADTLLYTTGFLSLNKAHIIAVAPVGDLSVEGNLGIWLSSLRVVLEGVPPPKETSDE